MIETYIRGLINLEFAKKKFHTADPCPGTNFSQLWREFFFGEKLKGDVRRIGMRLKQSNTEGIRKGAATIFADLRMHLSRTGK